MTRLAALMLLGMGMMFAQQPKTATEKKPAYTCVSGGVIWNDANYGSAKSKAEKDTASKDCRAKFDTALEKFQKDNGDAEEKIKKLNRSICESRVSYRHDGTDDPTCAGIPPRLEALQAIYESCQNQNFVHGEICRRLLPLSMGKPAPKTVK